MAFSQFLDNDRSIRAWLTTALPLEIAPFFAEAEAAPVSPTVVPVVPLVTHALYNVANTALEFTISVNREQLKSGYSEGFQTEPLNPKTTFTAP